MEEDKDGDSEQGRDKSGKTEADKNKEKGKSSEVSSDKAGTSNKAVDTVMEGIETEMDGQLEDVSSFDSDNDDLLDDCEDAVPVPTGPTVVPSVAQDTAAGSGGGMVMHAGDGLGTLSVLTANPGPEALASAEISAGSVGLTAPGPAVLETASAVPLVGSPGEAALDCGDKEGAPVTLSPGAPAQDVSAAALDGVEAGQGGPTAEALKLAPSGVETDASPALGPLLERVLAEVRNAGRDPIKKAEVVVKTPLIDAKIGTLTTPKRRSSRRAGSVDEDSVERAARLVAKKNLEEPEGAFQRNTLGAVLGAVAKGGGKSTYHIGLPCS